MWQFGDQVRITYNSTDFYFLYPQKGHVKTVLVGQFVFPGREIDASRHQAGDYLISINEKMS